MSILRWAGAFALLLALGEAGDARANLAITRFSVDGGGGTSQGGGFVLGGTAGQSDAGLLSGSDFTLAGGFWAGGGGVPTGVEDGSPDGGVETVPPALAFRLFPITPNPAAESAGLVFDLPEARRVRVEVYDAAGRSVRILVNDLLAAGRNRLEWDRKDDEGVRVPAGIYFVRFDAGADHRRQKIVVVS